MEGPAFRQNYQKYKVRVKLWEKDFKKKHGRIPSKYDIRDASQEIRNSYKMYYKLKTAFLEDTLNDVLADDGFDVLEMSQTDGCPTADTSLTESINGGPQLPLNIAALVEASSVDNKLPTSTENLGELQELTKARAINGHTNHNKSNVIKEFEAVEDNQQNALAWGSEVSKQPVVESNKKAKEPTRKSLKSNLNQKLFTPTFSKRNPRKSLSRSALETSSRSSQNSANNDLDSAREVLPDLETILIQKAKEQQSASVIVDPLLTVDKSKGNIRTKVDEGWLERTEAQNGLKATNISKTEHDNNQTSHTISRKETYGLSNIDISKFNIKTTEATKSTVSSEMSEGTAAQENSSATVNQKTTEEVGSKKNVITVKQNDSDSDSIVDDSEEEKEAQEYRHIVKRRRVVPGGEAPLIGEPLQNVEISTEINLNKYSNENDDNEEFVAEKSKSKRKIARAKRAKRTTVEKPKSQTKPKANKSKSSKETNVKRTLRPRKKTTMPPDNNDDDDDGDDDNMNQLDIKEQRLKETNVKRTLRSRKKSTMPPDNNDDDDDDNMNQLDIEEQQRLNPEELKYALALERGDITSVPRVKLTELDMADDVAQRYINTSTPAIGISSKTKHPAAPIDEKRVAARRKLEEKIAAGKLNENYVTINIQKKTFVRGKKSINYSKYKKKQWKDKKRVAALTGPDMYMGGCDGGVLKCFTCGQVGHFAQNCKVKGDALLPLTAQLEEDPSPFPTLEEAERMASQSAAVVHSRNIEKLPAAANAAIYKDTNEEQTNGSESEKEDSQHEELTIETDDEFENVDLDEIMADAENEVNKHSPIKKFVGHKIPSEFLKAAGLDITDLTTGNCTSKFRGVSPLYELNGDGSVPEVTAEVLEVLHMFGHRSFRKGQDRAIMRILSGLSTLVTLSTGSGKSLCYQLPAYLYSRQKKSITLVISPLVSLMEDQVTGVPHFLRAHCLHTNQTPQQRVKIMQKIADGEIDVLLVSPEAVVAGERSTGFGSILRQLPPIAFACIDEAHCVSQWSHNFRPSYLMICKVLRKNLGVRTVLGLTATATLPTRLSIIDHLGITDGENGIISDTPLPDNLILSVSKDENRDKALLELLCSKRFEECQSIIIYCTRRDECERVAGFLRTYMQDQGIFGSNDGKRKRKRSNWYAEPYHAGMPASRRRSIQNAFMRNELRVVVATIAFGMGINKPDIRAVIHYNMPRNFESYVQEIGRAGRDGKISHCHLFLDARGGDQHELRRHIYANSIDRHVIRKLLQHIFIPCSCDKNLKGGALLKSSSNESSNQMNVVAAEGHVVRERICPGHEIGVSIEKTVEELDIPAENISTLLCYMELDPRWSINVLSSAYIMAKIISYGGPKYFKYAAKECPPLAMAIAIEIKKNTFKEDTNIIEFSVVDVAAAIGWNSGVVKYQLKNLEWVQVNGSSRRSPISVNFYDLGFRIKAPGDFTTEEIDEALDALYERSLKQEHTQLIQLQYVFQGLSSVAYNTYVPCGSQNFAHDRSDQLKGIVRDYFRNDYPKDLKLEIDDSSVSDSELCDDVNSLINLYPDNNFSGRNIARIFHGISSPNYPALMWSRCKYWRAHSKTDFNRLVRLANSVIVQRRT